MFLSRIKATILFVGGFDSVVIDSVRHQTPQTVAWVRKCPSESHYQESRCMNVIEQPWVSVCMCVMGPWRHPEVRGHATQGLEMPSHITSLATGSLCVWKCVECPSAAYIWPSVCKWCVFTGTCVSIGNMSLICLCLLCDGWSVSSYTLTLNFADLCDHVCVQHFWDISETHSKLTTETAVSNLLQLIYFVWLN